MAARKSMAYINSIIPVDILTEEDLIARKLKPGKFVLTITANIKILGIIILLASVAIILVDEHFCKNNENIWYLMLISGWLSIGVALLFYLIFSIGATTKKPITWVRLDIAVILILALLTIISSAIATDSCATTGSSFAKAPGPLGIVGGSILLIGCASMFLMYRFQEERAEVREMSETPTNSKRPELSRKSVFA